MRAWILLVVLLAGCGPARSGGTATAPSDERTVPVATKTVAPDQMGAALAASTRLHEALVAGRPDLARPALQELQERLTSLDYGPAMPMGGGGGAVVGPPEPSPTPHYDELDPNQLLEQAAKW